MPYSRECIKHALEDDGSSSIDGHPVDWSIEVLEKADPKVVKDVSDMISLEQEEIGRSIKFPEGNTSDIFGKPKTRKRDYNPGSFFHFNQD